MSYDTPAAGMMQYAVDLAASGFDVFPVVDGKAKPELATTDTSKIRAWFKVDPKAQFGAIFHSDTATDTEKPLAWYIKQMNRRFAVVNGSNNCGAIVDLSEPQRPRILKKESFGELYQNKKFAVENSDGAKMVALSTLWRNDESRREISAIVFEPPGSPFEPQPGEHNCWRGFAVEPREGDSCIPLLNHIHENICGGKGELTGWFLAWLADLVQLPGAKPGVAVALRGGFGAGKSIVYEYLRRIFGPHAMKVSRPDHLTGRFNYHMTGLVLLGVEEAFWAGDKAAESVLKDLITGRELTVEQKFADPITVHNHVHVLVTSNADWVVPAAAGDRRWAVLDVRSDRADDRDYWAPIYEALDGDGPAHLLHFLLKQIVYDHAVLHRPPMTKAKVDQAMEHLTPIERWWLDVLHEAFDLVRHTDRPEPWGGAAFKDEVFDSYRKWCEDNRVLRPDASSVFWPRLEEIATLEGRKLVTTGRSRRNGSKVWLAWFASIDECRAAMAARLRTTTAHLFGEGGSEGEASSVTLADIL